MMTMRDHNLAKPLDRLAAQFIDFLFAICFLILVTLLSAFLSGLSEALAGIVGTLGFLVAISYLLCADGLRGGQSYGKQVMGICVIDATLRAWLY
jgi:uncharacterized RDD family membrane protein YckC